MDGQVDATLLWAEKDGRNEYRSLAHSFVTFVVGAYFAHR